MKYFAVLITLLVLGSCVAVHTDKPAVAPMVAGPKPVVTQDGFIAAFSDVCLKSPLTMSYVTETAADLGMVQTKAESHGETYRYIWQTDEERGLSGLEMELSTFDIFVTLISSNEPDYSGIPSRSRRCELRAFLTEMDDLSVAQLVATVEGPLTDQSKQLDFSTYSDDYEVTADDVSVGIELPEPISLYNNRDDTCRGMARCRYLQPTTLSLEVVIDRLQ